MLVLSVTKEDMCAVHKYYLFILYASVCCRFQELCHHVLCYIILLSGYYLLLAVRLLMLSMGLLKLRMGCLCYGRAHTIGIWLLALSTGLLMLSAGLLMLRTGLLMLSMVLLMLCTGLLENSYIIREQPHMGLLIL